MKSGFIDSNLIVYANDRREPEKQSRALELVQAMMMKGCGVISTQVLQEYANVALTKLDQESSVILRQLRLLENLHIELITPEITRRAVEIKITTQISFWDANIVAAAESAECDFIVSEDLNAGQLYAGMEVVDPFTSKVRIGNREI